MYFIIPIAAFIIAAVGFYAWVMLPASPMRVGNGEKEIACVGDSITYGFGVVLRRKKYAFPALLASMLGEGYTTVNYGLSDRALLSSSDKPYFKEKRGKAAWDAKADTVIFMLGTNDCKQKNWKKDEFEKEYEAAVKHYTEKGVRLITVVPPRIFYKHISLEGYHDSIMKDELRPLVLAISEKYGVECVDLYALTETHPEWFPDKLHPNKAGNQAIAEEIYKFMTR